MKNTCWKLFSYLTIDHQAAQDRLNEMASVGWELDLLLFDLFARFRRTERTDLTYFLDWADPNETEESDYLRMCAEAGWDIKDELGYWNLYVSRPGLSPVPIQTDPELEYQRFRQKALRRMALNLIPLLLTVLSLGAVSLVLGTPLGLHFWEGQSESMIDFALLVLLPLWSLGGLAHLVLLWHRLRSWQKALRRGKAPSPSRQAAEIWKVISALGFLLPLLFFFLSEAVELLLNSGGRGRAGFSFILLLLCFTFQSFRRNARKERQFRILLLSCAGVCLICLLLHTPFRSFFPGRLPTGTLLENTVVDGEFFRTDAPLGSYRSWAERAVMENGEPDPMELSLFQARTYVTAGFAQRMAQAWAEEGHMAPAEGLDGVWRSKNGTGYVLLYKNTCLSVLYYEGPPEVLYQSARKWMESLS